ncbi:flavin-containing monooxygenase [Paenibacillus xylanilyticus]|uniref:NAD(P)-binding domain-containing protein n=1 Tax=Paenibacillus xylanilyticus TaxID=248903 RepID=A0A7Y6ESW7_9BACL|nr:NAD(P)-binding domain-containing protein [Paenibacillus xylanilyticus]NUU75382.1 NAD(P)-binding domain-containing protein [Paenibacillus xylanilyticus]
MIERYDVIVIGAGQAGLAASYFLKNRNLRFLLIDKSNRIGESWRQRYDSLTLFTPRSYSSLPGLPLEGDPNGYATKDEISTYLEKYATTFTLPIQLSTEVISLEAAEQSFDINTTKGMLKATNVIVSTGPFQSPYIPLATDQFHESVFQIHTSAYSHPKRLNKGTVIVIGAGNSGAQIAVELAKERDVFLSVGRPLHFMPLQVMGTSIFSWFRRLGIMNVSAESKLGKFIQKKADPIFGIDLKKMIRNKKIKLVPRAVQVMDRHVQFEDGSKLQVDNVIWATGFRTDYTWIKEKTLFNEKGGVRHQRGVSDVQGLFFLGIPWQSSRGSALIGGVGADAEYIVSQIK